MISGGKMSENGSNAYSNLELAKKKKKKEFG